jgi:hypothetical protein
VKILKEIEERFGFSLGSIERNIEWVYKRRI